MGQDISKKFRVTDWGFGPVPDPPGPCEFLYSPYADVIEVRVFHRYLREAMVHYHTSGPPSVFYWKHCPKYRYQEGVHITERIYYERGSGMSQSIYYPVWNWKGVWCPEYFTGEREKGSRRF